jgi:hypothetical protein
MAKYTSGRQKNLKIGISSYSENLTSLEVIGNVGIGTTNATSKLTVSGNVNVIGVVTATSFSGSGAGLTSIPAGQLTGALPAIDGSALTGVTASSSGIVIKDDGSLVGTAGTIDFGANLSVSFASGIATITAIGQFATTSVGIHTLSNVGIGTTNPRFKLEVGAVGASGTTLFVNGDVKVAGVVSATSYFGSGGNLEDIIGTKISGIQVIEETTPLSGTYGILRFVGDSVTATGIGSTATITITTAGIVTFVDNAGIATNLKGGVVGNIPYQSAANTTAFLTNGGSGTILQSNGVGNVPTWVTAASAGAVSGLVIRDSNNNIVGTSGSVSQLTFSTGLSVTGTTGVAGIATITLSSNIVGTSLSISGISTLGTLRVSSGIVTATTGIITYFGDGTKLTGISSGTSITGIFTSTIQNLTFTSISSGSTTGLGVSASGLVYNPSTNSLGIGTTNPRAPLDVTSSIRVSAGAASTFDVTIKTYTNESGSLSFENSATGASLLTLQQSSDDILFDVSTSSVNQIFKVGIDSSIVVSSGVASRDFKIIAYPDELGSISFESAVNDTQYFSITQNISTLLFGVNDASLNPVFVVGAGGSVGIGTVNPLGKLQVGSGTSSFIITGIGSVGIGTLTPEKILHVNGGIRNTNRNSASTQTALHINTTTGDIAETASSRRFKRNIKDYEKGLETLMQLRAVSFQFLEDDLPNCGLIAEEVSKIGLSEFVRYDKNGDPYSIPYENLSALYINAIKELKLENDLLKIKIDELIIRINNFEL